MIKRVAHHSTSVAGPGSDNTCSGKPAAKPCRCTVQQGLRPLQLMFGLLCFAALLAAGPVRADGILPDEAGQDGTLFQDCTYDEPAATVTCNNLNINDTGTIIAFSEPLTLNITGGLNLPEGAIINPDLPADQVNLIVGNDLNTNGENVIINASVDAGGANIGNDGSQVNGALQINGNLNVNSGGAVNGPINATGNISVNDGAIVNGDMSAAGSVTINGDGQIQGSVAAEGSVTNNGSVLGNIDAGGSVANNSGAFAFSINANGPVTNDGQVASYINAPSVSGNGVVNVTCDENENEGPCEDAPDTSIEEFCEGFAEASGFGIIGTAGFSYGSGSQIISDQDYDIDGEGNTPTPTGNVDTVQPELSPLPDFPVFSSNNNLNNVATVNPGTYGRINTNNTIEFTAGDDYFIEELSLGNNLTIRMAPGNYYIHELDWGNSIDLEIVGSGQVVIHVRDSFEAGNEIYLNAGGNAENLRINLYSGATLDIGQGNQGDDQLTLNGLIYSPDDNTTIEFGNNNDIQGGILSNGTVDVGNNTTFFYSAEIQQQVNNAVGCTVEIIGPVVPGDLDHIRLTHPERLVSCFSGVVEVEACADEDCTERFADPLSVDVTALPNTAAWQSLSSGVTAAGNQVTFELADNALLAAIENVPGGTTGYSLADSSVTPENGLRCFLPGGAETACTTEFVTAGLVFRNAAGGATLNNQAAGNLFDLQLAAVEVNTETAACEARVSNDTQEVQLGFRCTDPASCQAGIEYTIDGQSVALNDTGSGTPANLSTFNLNFDANGVATLPDNFYPDVGLLDLYAELTLEQEPGGSEPGQQDPTVTLVSADASFISYPFELRVSALDENDQLHEATTDEAGAGFLAAGESFPIVIQSLTSTGEITPNFGQENTLPELTVTFDALIYPASGMADNDSFLTIPTGNFAVEPSMAGTRRLNGVRWADVGTISLVPDFADSAGYLGAGPAEENTPGQIGRFFPNALQIQSSAVLDSCLGSDFTYMDEPAIEVELEVMAINTDGETTLNYNNDYVGAAVLELLPTDSTDPTIASANDFPGRLPPIELNDWTNGELLFSADDLSFSRLADNSPDGPFANVVLGARVLSETDNRDLTATPLLTPSGNAAPLAGSLDLRYGRLTLSDISGPETEPLPVELQAEFWNSEQNRFVVNTDDNCTAVDPQNLGIVNNPDNLSSDPLGDEHDLVAGAADPEDIQWSAPDDIGTFRFEYLAEPWLQFDWTDPDLGGEEHDDPRANAAFGLFRGNDRVIHWLERNL